MLENKSYLRSRRIIAAVVAICFAIVNKKTIFADPISGCPPGEAYATFTFNDCVAGSSGGNSGGQGDGPGGGGSLVNQWSTTMTRVVGTDMRVEIGPVRSISNDDSPNGGKNAYEYIAIRHEKENGKKNYAGWEIFGASNDTCNAMTEFSGGANGLVAYQIMYMRPYLLVDGAKRVEYGASYAIWQAIDNDTSKTPIGVSNNRNLRFGMRLSHFHVCNALGPCPNNPGYYTEMFWLFDYSDRGKIDYDGMSYTGVHEINMWTQGNDYSRIIAAHHGVATWLRPPVAVERSSTSYDMFLTNHNKYETGCGNCVEGCSVNPLSHPCQGACGSPYQYSWDNSPTNIIPMNRSGGIERQYTITYIDDRDVLDELNPPYLNNLGGTRNIQAAANGSFRVCKGFVEGTPCVGIPVCVSCGGCGDSNLTWPIPLKYDGRSAYNHYYPGPWVCTKVGQTNMLHSEMTLDDFIQRFGPIGPNNPRSTQIRDPYMPNSYCGSGCGLLIGPPVVGANDYFLERAGASQYSGYWMGWGCGSGYLEIPASNDGVTEKWYATNSGNNGEHACYRPNSSPMHVESVAMFAWVQHNPDPTPDLAVVSGREQYTWVRMVNSDSVPTAGPIATPWPGKEIHSSDGCFGGPRFSNEVRSLANRCAEGPNGGIPTQPAMCP